MDTVQHRICRHAIGGASPDLPTVHVPRGHHGPYNAAPGCSTYHLDVLVGLGAERSMAFCDDPTHHWIRDEWAGMPLDPVARW